MDAPRQICGEKKGRGHALARLNPETVARFLEDLAEKDTRIRERVEVLFLSCDAAALSEALKARLDGFHALPEVLGFRDLFPLARDFRSFLSDTEILMAPLDAGVALDLVDRFLELDRLLEGLEEGGGPLQAVFFEACDLWLDLAARSGLDLDWGEKILVHFLADRSGARANLMRHGDRLLSRPALEALAARMLREAGTESGERGTEWHLYRFSMGLRYLSQALRDPDLMARSVTLVQQEPGPRQIADIVHAYLDYAGPEAALAWLTGDWGERELERLDLLDQVYAAMDDREMLFEIRRERYAAQPSAEHLLALLEVCTEEEQAAFLAAAPETARHTRSLYSGLNLLLSAEAIGDAEALLIERRGELMAYDHTAIWRMLEKFDAAGSVLGKILCYRALVEGILEEARFRAYAKAVTYCEALAELDGAVGNNGGVQGHVAYLADLRARFGDKRVFWQKLAGEGDSGGRERVVEGEEGRGDRLWRTAAEGKNGRSQAVGERRRGQEVSTEFRNGGKRLASGALAEGSERLSGQGEGNAGFSRRQGERRSREQVPRETSVSPGGREGAERKGAPPAARYPVERSGVRGGSEEAAEEKPSRKVPRGTPGGILG